MHNVANYVYYEVEYPNVKYLIDGYEYLFNEIKCLALGGAYSVDKYYRLEKGWHWFSNEQLSWEERDAIMKSWYRETVHIILSHTCPISLQPRDLFLSTVDQSKVDNAMELWLEEIKESVNWNGWLFGHYHQTRNIAPGVKMLSNDILLDLERWYINN